MPADEGIPGSPAEWLAYAKSDLAIARVALPEDGTYESLCFHAQQAAEKAIKAVYRVYRQSFRYTHDIDDLLDGLSRYGIDIPEAIWEAGSLTRFSAEMRYPGFNEPVLREEYEQVVAHAERVVAWAAQIIQEKAR